MYVPATSAQPAAPAVSPLTPIMEITAGGSSPGTAGLAALGAAPERVWLTVRRPELNVLADHASTIAGALQPDITGRMVALQALGARGWSTIASSQTGRGGRFRVRYVPRRAGSERVRLRFAGDASHRGGAHRSLGRLNVYRLAEASWYGGGGGLACGGELTSTTMGVANKTLPCGTLVTLRYGERTVRVRVIDRGPYVAGREFDLTEATKQALGFGDTGEVWSTR